MFVGSKGLCKSPELPGPYIIMAPDMVYDVSQYRPVIAISRFLDSVRAAANSASFSDVATYFYGLYRNDKVNWAQVLFLTTCVIAMTGCGVLSSSVRRKWLRSPPAQRASRKSSKSTSRTLSSSEDDYEDDDYDSNASLRHGTNPNYKPKEDWLSEPEKLSSDGELRASTRFWYSLTTAQRIRQTPAFSGNSLPTTPILPR